MTEKEEKFNKIVANYPKSDFFSGKLCPDQYVGKIADFKNEDGEVKEDFPVRVNIFAGQTADVCIKFSSYEKIMILILESPHQDEFDEKGNPIGPANGPTGTNIRAYIQKNFSVQEFKDKFGSIDQYHLILMNAIPFQCSLGFPLSKKDEENKKRRDKVFAAVWNKFGKEFFKSRLEELLNDLQENSKNVAIVNACTIATDKTQNSEDLHCMVCRGIQDVMMKNKFAFYHTVHPSSGHWCRQNYKLNDDVKKVPCSNRRKCIPSQIVKN